MEKLIDLLNEYEAERHKTSVIADIREQKEDNLSYLWMNWNYSELLCISKGYEFIKRLVENNKIDTTNKFTIITNVENKENWLWYSHTFEWYEALIMLLSIQDNPIEFLIGILK